MASKTRENSPGDEDAASAVSSASPAPLSSPVVAYHTMISKPVTVLEPEWSSDEKGGTHLVVHCAAVSFSVPHLFVLCGVRFDFPSCHL